MNSSNRRGRVARRYGRRMPHTPYKGKKYLNRLEHYKDCYTEYDVDEKLDTLFADMASIMGELFAQCTNLKKCAHYALPLCENKVERVGSRKGQVVFTEDSNAQFNNAHVETIFKETSKMCTTLRKLMGPTRFRIDENVHQVKPHIRDYNLLYKFCDNKKYLDTFEDQLVSNVFRDHLKIDEELTIDDNGANEIDDNDGPKDDDDVDSGIEEMEDESLAESIASVAEHTCGGCERTTVTINC